MEPGTTKFSPGPWRWKPDNELSYNEQPVLLDASGAEVCCFGDDENYYPTCGSSPTDDDARLIAAAPELLAALKVWLSSGLGTNLEHLALIERIEGPTHPGAK